MPSKQDSTEHFANVAEEIHDIVATTVDDTPEITPLARSTQANVVRQSDDENPDDSAELEHTNPPTMRTDPYDHSSAKEGWTIFCFTANCDPNANKVFLEEDFDDVKTTYPIARSWRYVRSQVAGRFDVLLWVPPDFQQGTPHLRAVLHHTRSRHGSLGRLSLRSSPFGSWQPSKEGCWRERMHQTSIGDGSYDVDSSLRSLIEESNRGHGSSNSHRLWWGIAWWTVSGLQLSSRVMEQH
jgi:hypothetical protein